MKTAKKKGTSAKPAKPAMAVMPTSKEEAKWRAEDDARTLVRAEEIKLDKKRLNNAQAHAKKQIKELSKVVKK
jgi:ABC-type xylose transport system substrate-binding protein